MTENIVEPRIAKRIGLAASFGVLALSSVAYATQAAKGSDGLMDQISAGGMASLPGLVALGALAAAAHTSRRRQGVTALAVGVGALGIQCINGSAYWESRDAGVIQAKAQLSEARKVEARFEPIPSQPIKVRMSALVEEGGPRERRWIRQERRRLAGELAEAQQSEAMKTSLRAHVVAAEGELAAAKGAAGFVTWAKTFVFTMIEAAGPAAMALSAKGREAPAPKPQPAPVNPASGLANIRWAKRREELAKQKALNELAC